MKTGVWICFFFLAAACDSAIGADCRDYPYSAGIEIVADGATSYLLSTEEASADGSDRASLLGARREAELLARARLAEYFDQTVESNENLDSNKITTRNTDGDSVRVSSSEIKRRMLEIKTRSRSALKAARTVGSCHNKRDLFARATIMLPLLGDPVVPDTFDDE